MRFGVLGPLAVWTSGGAPVTVPGLKVRALLADLLVHEGRPVPADRLVDDLWGDDELPGNPAAALSAKVSQLRRVLEDAEPGGRDLLVHAPAGYQLTADTDAGLFRSLLTEAERTGDPAARAARLADALAQWRGPAFADFADFGFTRAAAARLQEQRLAAVEDRAEVRLALGEHAALAGELGDLLTEHPLRERLRAAHMRALYRSGRPSEALDSYERLRVLLAEELGLDPGAELVALHRAVLTQDPALAAPAAQATNLPVPLTDLIGRDDAIAGIRARLDTGRLVTLTGPGGVGKTRLAVEAARGLAFPDGVWLVELAALDRPADEDALPRLAETIIAVLDVRDAGDPVDRLVEALRPRRTVLLLDNCEHVIEPVARLAGLLLAAAPGLRLLATSQEPLALPGEVVWAVPPLEVPDPAAGLAELERTGSVRLFAARAAAASRGFTLDSANAAAVAVLCRRLDGIPLALELAATRVRALGVQGMVERLDDRFRLLATGHRGAPPRQQTLMAMIDWSWDLLGEADRVVLRRLAVHADGCTLEAAEAVCGDDVIDVLPRLVDRSLVVMVDGPDGPRYRLLESVSAYCVARLQQEGELEEVRRRHHAYYADLAERAEPYLRGDGQRRWLLRLDAESANLRAALNTAVRDGASGGALRLANALAWYWYLRGRLSEAVRSLSAALGTANGEAPSRVSDAGGRARVSDVDEAASRARALAWLAGFAFLRGGAADRSERRAVALRAFEQAGDEAGRARAAWFLAHACVDLGDLADAEELVAAALPVFEALGDDWGTAAALATRAKIAHVRCDLDTIERDCRRSLALFERLGDRWGRLEASAWLGALAELTGDLDAAERLQREGLHMAEELGLSAEAAGRLAWLGWLALQRGEYAAAMESSERALRLAVGQDHQPLQIFATMGLAFSARQRGLLDLAESHLRDVLERTSPAEAEEQPPPHLPLVLVELGFVAEQRGDAAEALRLHLRAFDAAGRLGEARGFPVVLHALAGALAAAGRPEHAAWFLGHAAAVRSGSPVPPAAAELRDIDRITARIRAELGEERFAAECERGGLLTRDELLNAARTLPQ